MSVHAYVPEWSLNLDRDTHDRVLELADEDPVRFIRMDEPDTALAVIRGINSLERLTGWRLANQSFFEPPKQQITEALEDREAELTGESTEDTEPESEPDESDSEPSSEARPDSDTEPNTHADATDVLEAGDVLVIDRGTKTEYVWPAREGEQLPYVSQAIDNATDEVWMETGVSAENVRERRASNDSRVTDAADLEIDTPTAALGGGR